MKPVDFNNKTISLIVWNTETEDDVQVYPGKFELTGAGLFFVNAERGWKVLLDKEQLERVSPVPEELKEMLMYSEYALTMSMGELPESDADRYNATGMKWRD